MKRLLVLFALICTLSLGLLGLQHAAVSAQNDAKSQALQGVNKTQQDVGSNAETGVKKLIKNTLTIISYIAGVSAVILIIIGGFYFVTAEGDPTKISSARNTVIYATVGIVIVAIAQSIVRLVVNRV